MPTVRRYPTQKNQLQRVHESVKLLQGIRDAWSSTTYSRDEVTEFAQSQIIGEVRNGVRAMSLVLGAIVLVATAAHHRLGLNDHYISAYLLVGALCVHIFISAGQVRDVRGLYLLGMALLVISATALVFVAHRTGNLSPLLLANVLLLFVVVPMVPWGLREAGIVTVAIWVLLTSSTLGVAARFGADTLMLLQVFMFTTAFASLSVVARATTVRKGELAARHDLEEAQDHLFRLSNIDPLTGAWNRRYLQPALNELCSRLGPHSETFEFVLFDLDDFKMLNDAFGHAAGDQILMCVATALRDHIGERGHLIRLGGDEFCALFVAEDPDGLLRDAIDDIRQRVRSLAGLEEARVSISYGRVSGALDATISIPALYRRADRGMYKAKEARSRRTLAAAGQSTDFEESGTWMVLGS